eukprot:scaffold35_cov178-Alexandrium_tamarense.AAC.6
MAGAKLPPLPSMRAKELEKRALYMSQTNTDANVQNESIQSPVYVSESTSAFDSPSKRIHHRESYDTDAQIDEKRSEQLAMLHHKEQKVFGQQPPLEPNITCDAIHQYLSTTSQFLNSYVADANVALEGTSKKLTVLEKQMALLETRLASIPGLFPEEGDEGKDCEDVAVEEQSEEENSEEVREAKDEEVVS